MKIWELEIETLSPLHIGWSSIERITPFDYLRFGQYLYVVDQEKLARSLHEYGLLTDFVNFAKEKKKPTLSTFLDRHELNDESFAKKIMRYRIKARVQPNEVLPFIKNAYGRPYIPGSSIKGALRTGVMYYILKHSGDNYRQKILINFVQEALKKFEIDRRQRKVNREKFKKSFAQELERRIFQEYRLVEYHRKFDPHTDIFRVIKTDDSGDVDAETLKLMEVKVYSYASRERNFSIYVEGIPPRIKFRTKLRIDEELWLRFERANTRSRSGIPIELVRDALLDPLKATKEMASDLYEYEKKFFSAYLRMPNALSFDTVPDMRLGWGSGLLGITVDFLLPEDLRKRVRNMLFIDRGEAVAPKSRKVSITDGKHTWGWIKLRIV